MSESLPEKKDSIRLAIDFENFETKFADSVQMETGADHIVLNFVQQVPGAPDNQPNGKIISRIALSWPHFGRLLQMMNQQFENRKGSAVDSLQSSISAIFNRGFGIDGPKVL